MMGSSLRCLTLVGVLVLAFASPALGSYHGADPPAEDATEVDAAGNPFTGGLAFEPAGAAVEVGESVRWTNTDFFAPHTATEDNGLWELSGDYGLPFEGFHGFGPGESRERRFEAATWSYFCAVHPEDMRGTIEVPVELRSRRAGGQRRARGPRFNVIARWSREALPEGQAFDVQRRVGGRWRTLREGTERRMIRFRRVRRGARFAIRARVRDLEQPAIASGWSPPARLRAGR